MVNYTLCFFAINLFFTLVLFVFLILVIIKKYNPYVSTDSINTSIQFLASVLGGLASSIVIIYVANLQNNVQKEFIITQEYNERERLLLNFYIDKISEFEHKNKCFIAISNEFIQNCEHLNDKEIRTYFNKIRDKIILLYRFKKIFKHMEISSEWLNLETMISSLHNFMTNTIDNIDNEDKRDIADNYKNNYYLEIIIILSEISNKLLTYQEAKIDMLLVK